LPVFYHFTFICRTFDITFASNILCLNFVFTTTSSLHNCSRSMCLFMYVFWLYTWSLTSLYFVLVVLVSTALLQSYFLAFHSSLCSFSSIRIIVSHFHVLHFSFLQYCAIFCFLAFSCPEKLCRIFMSHIFSPCIVYCEVFLCPVFSVASLWKTVALLVLVPLLF